MVDVTYQMVLSTIQTASLVVGIVYYLTIMRNTQKTNEQSLKSQEAAEKAKQRELVFQRGYTMEYAQAFTDVSLMEDWTTVTEFNRKYGRKTNPEAHAKLLYIRNVFNSAGLVLKEKDIDPEVIFQLYAPGSVISLWEKQLPVINYIKELFNYHGLYSGFEYLYNEAKSRYPDLIYPRNLD